MPRLAKTACEIQNLPKPAGEHGMGNVIGFSEKPVDPTKHGWRKKKNEWKLVFDGFGIIGTTMSLCPFTNGNQQICMGATNKN
jgi:hypothetical protein